MRRKDREVTDFNEIVKIIDECEVLQLGLADGDYPYIVPVNFAYRVTDGRIEFFIHGAMAGRKYELMRKNPRCSFEMDIPLGIDFIPEKKDVTMRYKCVMGKADIKFLETIEAKAEALEKVIMARRADTAKFDWNRAALSRVAIAKLVVTEITAKANPFKGGAD